MNSDWRRYCLGALLAFGALNAFAGGYHGLAGAPGVPLEWLEGSVFDDYFIPSLILFVVVGGVLLMAAVTVFAGSRLAALAGGVAGYVVLFWICVQLAIIGYVSWMQPATFIAGILVLALAATLGRPNSAGERHDGGGQ
jgi:hypothetical protein